MDNKSLILIIIGWMFGVLVFVIGVINTFWGNDLGFGISLVLLSFAYFPPANNLIRKMTGFSIPKTAKIILGLFILWASLGVGELFDKINIMMTDLQ